MLLHIDLFICLNLARIIVVDYQYDAVNSALSDTSGICDKSSVRYQQQLITI